MPSPLPAHQLVLSGRRLSGLAVAGSAGGSAPGSGAGTPRSRSARMAAYLGSKLGRVAKLLAGEGEGSEAGGADTPLSAVSSAPGACSAAPALLALPESGAAGSPRGIGAWLDRTHRAFDSVEALLGADLAGEALAGRPQGLHVRCCLLSHCRHALPRTLLTRPSSAPAATAPPLPAGVTPGGAGLLSGRSPTSSAVPAPGLPDSARQRAQAAALEAALEHSGAEVHDLLAALDATSALAAEAADAEAAAAAAAAEGAIGGVRAELATAHERVQAAAARMQAAASEAEQLKRQHAGLHQQVGCAGPPAPLPACWWRAGAAGVLPLPLPSHPPTVPCIRPQPSLADRPLSIRPQPSHSISRWRRSRRAWMRRKTHWRRRWRGSRARSAAWRGAAPWGWGSEGAKPGRGPPCLAELAIAAAGAALFHACCTPLL